MQRTTSKFNFQAHHDIDGRPKIDSDYDPLLERLLKAHGDNNKMIETNELNWRGDVVYYKNRKLTQIEPDAQWPGMWRVRLPDGKLTDMVNRTRARDAARVLAAKILNSRESPPEADVVR